MHAYQSLDLRPYAATPTARPDPTGAWVVTFRGSPALLPVEEARLTLTREQLACLVQVAMGCKG